MTETVAFVGGLITGTMLGWWMVTFTRAANRAAVKWLVKTMLNYMDEIEPESWRKKEGHR